MKRLILIVSRRHNKILYVKVFVHLVFESSVY